MTTEEHLKLIDAINVCKKLRRTFLNVTTDPDGRKRWSPAKDLNYQKYSAARSYISKFPKTEAILKHIL